MGIFRHGQMDDSHYALGVFQSHYQRCEFDRKGSGFVALELGPGDSCASAIIANAHGAVSCYLVDAGDFAVNEIAAYRGVIEELKVAGIAAKNMDDCKSKADLLARVGGIYLTDGLASLQSVPADSVDFVWSHAVLEHVRKGEFDDTLHELHRIMRSGGVASHRVDLTDHLGGSLHNMRIPSSSWEKSWMAKSGFYTNRIRYSDMIDRFKAAGFEVNVLQVDRWDEPPVKQRKLAKEFSNLSHEDLCISSFDVVLRKAD